MHLVFFTNAMDLRNQVGGLLNYVCCWVLVLMMIRGVSSMLSILYFDLACLGVSFGYLISLHLYESKSFMSYGGRSGFSVSISLSSDMN